MAQYKFTVVIERDEDRVYVASVPALQGCHTQGDTYEEALENVKDAIRLHLEARKELGEPVPIGGCHRPGPGQCLASTRRGPNKWSGRWRRQDSHAFAKAVAISC